MQFWAQTVYRRKQANYFRCGYFKDKLSFSVMDSTE